MPQRTYLIYSNRNVHSAFTKKRARSKISVNLFSQGINSVPSSCIVDTGFQVEVVKRVACTRNNSSGFSLLFLCCSSTSQLSSSNNPCSIRVLYSLNTKGRCLQDTSKNIKTDAFNYFLIISRNFFLYNRASENVS